MHIEILLGSTREGRLSQSLGNLTQKHLTEILKANDLKATVGTIDLCDYKIPFLNDATPPMYRDPDTISNPDIKQFSATIKKADLILILAPIYNFGITGVLKNALDTLYREWNDKPVAYIGYSGGPSGGSEGVSMLRTITVKGLKMKPIVMEEKDILLPSIFNTFNPKTNSFNQTETDDKFKNQLEAWIKAWMSKTMIF